MYSPAIERCLRAYTANHIPITQDFVNALQRLSDDAVIALAERQEQAAEEPESPDPETMHIIQLPLFHLLRRLHWLTGFNGQNPNERSRTNSRLIREGSAARAYS